MDKLLEIKDLKVEFVVDNKTIDAVSKADLAIGTDEVVVLAGESGSGKTVTAMAVTRILAQNARIVRGEVDFYANPSHRIPVDLLKATEDELVKIRGSQISYIFQEPASFLNPVFSVGEQISEVLMVHRKMNAKESFWETIRLLEEVMIKDPQRVFFNYPHQLSGGMNQRVFLAMSLACRPRLLIADEPTTALDVTIESQILELLLRLKSSLKFSLLFITHNLSIAKKIADRVYVMHMGKTVEHASTEELFRSPAHMHTRELINAYEKIGKI